MVDKVWHYWYNSKTKKGQVSICRSTDGHKLPGDYEGHNAISKKQAQEWLAAAKENAKLMKAHA